MNLKLKVSSIVGTVFLHQCCFSLMFGLVISLVFGLVISLMFGLVI